MGETRGNEQQRQCAQDLIKSPGIQLLSLSLLYMRDQDGARARYSHCAATGLIFV